MVLGTMLGYALLLLWQQGRQLVQWFGKSIDTMISMQVCIYIKKRSSELSKQECNKVWRYWWYRNHMIGHLDCIKRFVVTTCIITFSSRCHPEHIFLLCRVNCLQSYMPFEHVCVLHGYLITSIDTCGWSEFGVWSVCSERSVFYLFPLSLLQFTL